MAAWTCPFACPLVHTRGAYTRLHRQASRVFHKSYPCGWQRGRAPLRAPWCIHAAHIRAFTGKPPGYSINHTHADGSVDVPLCVPLGAYTRRIYAPSPVPSKVFHKSYPCGWLNRFKSHNTAQRVQNRLKITIFTG